MNTQIIYNIQGNFQSSPGHSVISSYLPKHNTFTSFSPKFIINGDWNQDVQTSTELLRQFKDRNISPTITQKFHNAPATYNNGQVPIDEIFVSSGIIVEKCGYLPHGENNGDHRPIWIEVSKDSFLGTKPPPVVSIKARRLKTNNPAIVQKYNYILQQELEVYNVYNRVYKLYTTHSTPMTHSECKEYDKLDIIREKAMKKA